VAHPAGCEGREVSPQCPAFITARLYDLGLSAVAVQLPWPPQVSIEFAPSVLREPEPWRKVKEFLDEYLDELGKKVFDP